MTRSAFGSKRTVDRPGRVTYVNRADPCVRGAHKLGITIIAT
jgi:hypothetical protein